MLMVVLNPVPQKDGWIWVGIVFCLRMRLKSWSFSFLWFCRGGCGHHLVNFSGFIQGLQLASGGIQCKYIIPRAGPAAKFQHVSTLQVWSKKLSAKANSTIFDWSEAEQSPSIIPAIWEDSDSHCHWFGGIFGSENRENKRPIVDKKMLINNFQKEKQALVVSEQNNYHGIFHGPPFFICFFLFGVAHSVFAYRSSPVTFPRCVTLVRHWNVMRKIP